MYNIVTFNLHDCQVARILCRYWPSLERQLVRPINRFSLENLWLGNLFMVMSLYAPYSNCNVFGFYSVTFVNRTPIINGMSSPCVDLMRNIIRVHI